MPFRFLTSCLLATALLLGGCGGAGSGSSSAKTPATSDDPVPEPAPETPPDTPTPEQAARLLNQATFGPTEDDVGRVVALGYEGWVDDQLNTPSAYDSDTDDRLTHLERTLAIGRTVEPGFDWDADPEIVNSQANSQMQHFQLSAWWENALDAPDQLRQRVAYALSQIFVVSAAEPLLGRRAESLAAYYDLLARNAFGNFRDLIGDVTRSPAMGIWLTHQGNRKASADGNTQPDENYARELTQLFTIGLYELNIDGTPKRDENGDLIPTYDQQHITELSRVLTGWDLQGNSSYGRANSREGDYVRPMEFTAEYHDFEEKVIFGQLIPSGLSGEEDLDTALDLLFNHPNVGPFIGRQLIQRLVTSNPSPAYIRRVAEVFNDNGEGVRGDLKAVVRAILLDPEAWGDDYQDNPDFGKPREPVLAYSTMLRLLDARPLNGWSGRDENGVQPEIKVNGVYWLRYTQLGQMPLRAPTTFNFYSPDYVPSDSYFIDRQLVAPELEIQTAPNLITLSNSLRSTVAGRERHYLEQRYGSLEDYAADQDWRRGELLVVDVSDELALFETALDGNPDRSYDNLHDERVDENGDSAKARAIDALLDHLDRMLLAGQMEADYRHALRDMLLNYSIRSDDKRELEVRDLVTEALHAILTSSAFMIQK